MKRYGKEEGLKKFQSYSKKQAYKNTFECKSKKYGWTEEQFKKYNRNRATTLENLVRRHGQEEGEKIWKSYVERQKYTASLEYFIEEYGEEKGKEKYEKFDKARSENLIFINSRSLEGDKFCKEIDSLFKGDETYYGAKNFE